MSVPYRGKGQHSVGEVVILKNGRSAKIQPNGQMRFVSASSQLGGWSFPGSDYSQFKKLYNGQLSAKDEFKMYIVLGELVVDVLRREHRKDPLSVHSSILVDIGNKFLEHIKIVAEDDGLPSSWSAVKQWASVYLAEDDSILDIVSYHQFRQLYHGQLKGKGADNVYLDLGKVLAEIMKQEYNTPPVSSDALKIAGQEFMEHIKEMAEDGVPGSWEEVKQWASVYIAEDEGVQEALGA